MPLRHCGTIHCLKEAMQTMEAQGKSPQTSQKGELRLRHRPGGQLVISSQPNHTLRRSTHTYLAVNVTPEGLNLPSPSFFQRYKQQDFRPRQSSERITNIQARPAFSITIEQTTYDRARPCLRDPWYPTPILLLSNNQLRPSLCMKSYKCQ
jgi:hypothetical protein